MPYGVSKKLGGDTAGADAWIDKCVADVTAKGTPKQNAIRICKSSWQKHHAQLRKK